MTIPTAAEFEQLLAAAEESIEPTDAVSRLVSGSEISPSGTSLDVLGNLEKCPSLEVTRALAHEFLMSAFRERDRVWHALRTNFSAGVWLSGQREFDRAANLVHLGRRKPSDRLVQGRPIDEVVGERLTWALDLPLAKSPLNEAEPVVRRRYLFNALRRACEPFSTDWTYRCVNALHEYYYTDAWRRCIKLSREIQSALQNTVNAVRELHRQLADLETLRLTNLNVHQVAVAQRLVSQLKAYVPPPTAFPVRRVDQSAAERLFVFRMFKANKQVSRNAKTEAIVELMGLEGFKHQYDSRTVEKLCAGFTGMKRRVSREKPPGRLKEESPQISDGAKVPRSY